MNKEGLKYFRPAVFIFIFLTAFFITGKNFLVKKGFDPDVLLIGNIFLFLVTGFSFWLMSNGMKAKNNHAFIRSVYGGIMIKLFSCIVAAVIYIMTAKKDVNKPALFACMALYAVYTAIEVKGLMKRSAKQTNA
jgi:hypothetical protein